MSTPEQRKLLVEALRALSTDIALLSDLHAAYEFRREHAWFETGPRGADERQILLGALGRALADYQAPRAARRVGSPDLLPEQRQEISRFAHELTSAASTLPDTVVDRYFFFLHRHDVGPSQLSDAVRANLENYIRTKDSGLSADPW